MADSRKHKWVFPARFRRNAYGWRGSPLAVKRIKEAVREIQKAARWDSVLGAEGAVRFLEKLSPALENIDSSTGSLGTAVNNAIEALVPVIAGAEAEDVLRDKWLERLWQAVEEDEIPYLELLPDHWGELCVTVERANFWADDFLDLTRTALSPDPERRYFFFNGTSACLSALLYAGCYREILDLLGPEPKDIWSYTQFGVKALAAQGQVDEALIYAAKCAGLNEPYGTIAQVCEELLLSNGRSAEAYSRYAIAANQKNTYLATFRAIMKKYPELEPAEILKDLVSSTPGEHGKWFAAARSVGLLEEALHLARTSPCEPKTLIRAVGDLTAENSAIALEIGIAALHWLSRGYGYEITSLDIFDAVGKILEAAEQAGVFNETDMRIRQMIYGDKKADQFFVKYVEMELVRCLRLRHEPGS